MSGLVTEIRGLIGQAKTEVAIDILLELYDDIVQDSKIESSYRDDFIIIAGNFNGIKDEVRADILSPDDAGRRIAKTNRSIIKFLNDLPSGSISLLEEEWEKRKENQIKRGGTSLRKKAKSHLDKEEDEFKFDIFLCFSSKDIREAKVLWQNLRSYGFKVFLSEEYLKKEGGESFMAKIEEALKGSRHFIFFCTLNSVNSPWAITEYETFYNEYHARSMSKRKFIVYKKPEASEEIIPILLKRLQYTDNVESLVLSLLNSKKKTFSSPSVESEKGKKVFTYLSLVIVLFAASFFGVYFFKENSSSNSEDQSELVGRINRLIDNNEFKEARKVAYKLKEVYPDDFVSDSLYNYLDSIIAEYGKFECLDVRLDRDYFFYNGLRGNWDLDHQVSLDSVLSIKLKVSWSEHDKDRLKRKLVFTKNFIRFTEINESLEKEGAYLIWNHHQPFLLSLEGDEIMIPIQLNDIDTLRGELKIDWMETLADEISMATIERTRRKKRTKQLRIVISCEH